MLMPPLIDKWNFLKDEDKDLFPLLEVCCFVTVCHVSLTHFRLNKLFTLIIGRVKIQFEV